MNHILHKKCFAFLIIFYALLVMMPSPILCASSICIVENGRPKGIIIIAEDASQQIRQAAEELRDFIKESTKATLPIIEISDHEAKYSGQVSIRIGPSGYGTGLSSGGPFDADGFGIVFPDLKTIVISGTTDDGTLYGVYEFLERFVGIRWLFPGPLGIDVPEIKTLNVSAEPLSETPLFFSRQMSGFPNTVQKDWAKRMRLKGHIAFHHNMNRIIPPETYIETHPEFFPVLNGKRFLPQSNSTQGWQPCFTASGIVEEAVKNICDYFTKHPQEKSFSIGINDFGGFAKTWGTSINI